MGLVLLVDTRGLIIITAIGVNPRQLPPITCTFSRNRTLIQRELWSVDRVPSIAEDTLFDQRTPLLTFRHMTTI